MIYNINSSPLGLEDLRGPAQPRWYTTRWSIEEHRKGNRPPVTLHPELTQP